MAGMCNHGNCTVRQTVQPWVAKNPGRTVQVESNRINGRCYNRSRKGQCTRRPARTSVRNGRTWYAKVAVCARRGTRRCVGMYARYGARQLIRKQRSATARGTRVRVNARTNAGVQVRTEPYSGAQRAGAAQVNPMHNHKACVP